MASALLLASGTTGLAALQSLSIAMGAKSNLPYLNCHVFHPIHLPETPHPGVIYAVLISVACFSLHQGLESTLTGGSNQLSMYAITHVGAHPRPLDQLTPFCAGGQKKLLPPLASLTPHLLEPFASQPYSQLNLAKDYLSALACFKVLSYGILTLSCESVQTLFIAPYTIQQVCKRLKLPSLLVPFLSF